MLKKLKKFIKDRKGVSGLGRLLIILAMVGIVVSVALYYRTRAQNLGNKAYQESWTQLDRIS